LDPTEDLEFPSRSDTLNVFMIDSYQLMKPDMVDEVPVNELIRRSSPSMVEYGVGNRLCLLRELFDAASCGSSCSEKIEATTRQASSGL
jgi:hypothetical protein